MAVRKTRKAVAAKAEPEMKSAQELYQFLYKACNILRKKVEHESFKDYLTPLLYYKRISDVWDEEYRTALEESGGDEEYARLPEQHLFVIPEGCHWNDLRERGENLGSAYFPIKQRTDEAYWLPSTGIKIAVTNYIPIEAGSFTVEMFFRSDPELDTRIAGTTYPRYTFFCFYNKGLYSDWQMSGSYYPDLASGNCYLSCGASPPEGTSSVVGSTYNATKIMHDGEWHHFAVVYDDDARPRTQTLYVDGVKKYQNKLTAPLMPRNSADNPRCNYHLQIGYGANNHPIQGTFDEFRIVRKALQPSEFMKFKSLNGILMIVR